MYLKDHVPYSDSSLFVVIIRIQLELICGHATPPVVEVILVPLAIYIPAHNESTVVPTTRLRYTITTKVTVAETSRHHATQSTSHDANHGNNLRRNDVGRRYQHAGR